MVTLVKLLIGGSSGAAMWAALQAAKSLTAGQKCVVLLPDNIRNYMTKFISDQWMEARNFKPYPTNDKLWWWNKTFYEDDDLIQATETVSHSSSTAEAIATLRGSKASVVTIVNDKGSIIGVLNADSVRQRLSNLSGSMNEDLEKFTVKKFYKIDLSEAPTLGAVSRILDIAPFVVVVKTDTSRSIRKPIGVITSEDLLSYVTKKSKQVNGN